MSFPLIRRPALALACAGLLLPAALGAGLGPGPAFAATPGAWDEFRRAVETACLAAAAPVVAEPRIVVDPFGSESYGLALVTGTPPDGGERQSLICVFDKAAGRAEIGGTLALERAVPAMASEADPQATASIGPGAAAAAPATLAERLPQALGAVEAGGIETPAADVAALAAPASGPAAGDLFGGRCDSNCAATLEALADDDRVALVALSAQIRRAIDKAPDASLSAGPETGRETALALVASAEGSEEGSIAAPTAELAGSRSCTLYYYGYGNEAARTVGTHRCSVAEEEGTLVVEKTSGERLRAELRPLTAEMSAFLGRTFASDASETAYDAADPGEGEFGNAVGYAVEREGRLTLVSAQQRRFEAPVDFFWVLALDPA